jgi:sn-glycerol 3-phosphate transport system permease protein
MLADKHLRGIGVFRTIFSSTVATSVAVASLMWLFLLQADGRRALERRVDQLAVPVGEEPGMAAATLTPRSRPCRCVERVGQPRLHVHPGHRGPAGRSRATCTRPRPIDGAGDIRRFWSVTVPMLGPTLLFVVIVLVHPGVPDLRRDRPADRRRAATVRLRRRPITYFIYGQQLDHRSATTSGCRRRAAVLLFVMLLALSGAPAARESDRRVHYGD